LVRRINPSRIQIFSEHFSISNKDFRDNIQVQILGSKLLSYYVNQTPASGEQAAIEQIIFFNKSEANDVMQRWRGGEAFTTLSVEYSDYSQSGWVALDALDDSIRSVIATIEIGNISDPISIGNTSDDTSSSSGYYVIIKVLERKDDVLPDNLRQEWGRSEFNAWYQQDYAIKAERNPKLDLSEVYAWAVKQLS
jgi:hypothetical protein